MGECRKIATDAMGEVQPFRLTRRTLLLLVGTIDTVAWFLTGSTSHFHLGQMPHPYDIKPGT